MANEQHSPEPWRIDMMDDRCADMVDASGVEIIKVMEPNVCAYVLPADARRVVLCVNFLRGVPTEHIEDWLKHGLALDYSDHGGLSFYDGPHDE